MNDKKNQTSAQIINPGLGDIEKVRDILFGKYVSSFEERLAGLESQVKKQVDAFSGHIETQLSALDSRLSEASQQLESKINQQLSSTDAELNNMQQTLNESEQHFKHSIALMEDQAHQELKALAEQLSIVQQDILDQLAKQSEGLDQDKVSRDNLALMLDEVAMKLRNRTN